MDENTKAEPVQQDAPMPSAEPSEEVSQEAPKEDVLPESASERTKTEFEKLRNDLREERSRREAAESAFRTLQPKEVAPEPIYDPDTGFVDPAVLTETQRRAIEAEKRATKAEEAVSQFRQEQEAREAYIAYPEANPDAKEYDPKLKNLAAGVILQSMLNPQDFGGKQFSLKEAYDYLKSDTNSKAVEEARKEGAQEAIEQLTPKEQATLEATGTPARRSDVGSSHDTLVERTRRGDTDAIAERMNRIIGKQE